MKKYLIILSILLLTQSCDSVYFFGNNNPPIKNYKVEIYYITDKTEIINITDNLYERCYLTMQGGFFHPNNLYKRNFVINYTLTMMPDNQYTQPNK